MSIPQVCKVCGTEAPLDEKGFCELCGAAHAPCPLCGQPADRCRCPTGVVD